MNNTRWFAAWLFGWSALAGALSPAQAGTVASDDAYAVDLRRDMAREAIANSTTQREQALRRQARSGAECEQLKQTSHSAGQQMAVRHMAPDPTKIIENNTCFLDVQSIRIPSTGFGFADALIGKLVNMGRGQCAASTNSWSSVTNAVQSGNWQSVSNLSAIQGYTGSTQNLAPALNQVLADPGQQQAPQGVAYPQYNYGNPAGPVQQAQQPPSLGDRLWSKLSGALQ